MAKISKRVRKAQPQTRRKPLARKKTVAPAKAGEANLKQQLAEALERQTVTAEILKAISESPTDVQPVFDAIVESCTRLLACNHATLRLVKGDRAEFAASSSTQGGKAVVESPMSIHDDAWPTSQAVLRREVVQIPDTSAEGVSVRMRQRGEQRGFRSLMIAPMLRDNNVIGTIHVHRAAPGRFAEKEIALLETFASQAVIAIENVRLFNETKEALERQTASADILKVISGSPTNVQPVFDAIVNSAARLFAPCNAVIRMRDGDTLERVASAGPRESYRDTNALKRLGTIPFDADRSTSARAIVERRTIEVPDTEAPELGELVREIGRAAKHRSITAVPLMRAGEGIGTIILTHPQPGFKLSDKQLSLLQTFADQAVIAIENVRLFNETKEALERQTATSEILKVIASSRTEVQPVFDAILVALMRLFAGFDATVWKVDGEHLVAVSRGGATHSRNVARAIPITRDQAHGNVILDRKVVRLNDVASARDIPESARRGLLERGRAAVLMVPLIREGKAVGAISVSLTKPTRFSDKQVVLIETFADQAVIAIENVRLFNETKEALERQRATADVLASISGSMTDTQPVFDAIVRNLRRLFGTRFAVLQLLRDNMIEMPAVDGEPGFEKLRERYPRPLDETTVGGRAMLSKQAVQFSPVLGNPATPPATEQFARDFGFNSMLFTPMIHKGKVIGAIGTAHPEPKPFDDRQVALIKTFADQAVIAIENVRLFNETKEALERQTATAEILEVIASSPSDVQPVFEAIVQSALRLFPAWLVAVLIVDNEGIQLGATAGADVTASDIEAMRSLFPIPLDSQEAPSAVALRERRVLEVLDTEQEPRFKAATRFARAGRWRAGVFVPMVREGRGVGTVVLTHREPGNRLSDTQVALVQTFADQAVIAIENVRLFKELQSRTEALTKSVGQLTALGEVGQAISSTLDLETVLQTIVSRAVQLTGLDGGSIYEYDEQTEELQLQAAENMTQDIADDIRKAPTRKGDGALGRTALTLEPTQVSDTLDESYQSGRKELLVRAGTRALLAVPLLREGHLLGAILVNRRTPGPFAPEVVELLKTFATQSAMAIQNARLFREIAEKGKQLEDASRHKSNFLASMSHELRTPLNAILGFNEMILDEIYGPVAPDVRSPLEEMQASGKHLLRLINNVLDLAKIEAGRMELSLQDYSVHDTVESVRSTLRSIAAEKGLELLTAIPGDIPLAYGDPGRMSQCLLNLAGNALKFTKAGKVEIGAKLEGDQLVYRVSDTGIGIPADKIGSLFTEFKQTDATIASEYGGTGLGLSITKKFIEMHGGRIWIESELGKGSAFIFEVPLRAKTA